jgi:hypothetical protein
MKPIGHAVSERLPDGTLHIRWIPGPATAPAQPDHRVERLKRAKDAARQALKKPTHKALCRLGDVLFFPPHHFQIRSGAEVVAEFWLSRRAAWRFGDEMRKGSLGDFDRFVRSLQKETADG